MPDTLKKDFQWHLNMEIKSLVMIEPFREMEPHNISGYLNPLDYFIWEDLAEPMDWNNITSKGTLIDELKKTPNKVRAKVDDMFIKFPNMIEII